MVCCSGKSSVRLLHRIPTKTRVSTTAPLSSIASPASIFVRLWQLAGPHSARGAAADPDSALMERCNVADPQGTLWLQRGTAADTWQIAFARLNGTRCNLRLRLWPRLWKTL